MEVEVGSWEWAWVAVQMGESMGDDCTEEDEDDEDDNADDLQEEERWRGFWGFT